MVARVKTLSPITHLLIYTRLTQRLEWLPYKQLVGGSNPPSGIRQVE